jgi:hypothetical protein
MDTVAAAPVDTLLSAPAPIAQSSPFDVDCAAAIEIGPRQHAAQVMSNLSSGDMKDRVKYDKLSSALVSLVGDFTWHDMASSFQDATDVPSQ